MKRTISISLGGRAFNIEEDAYEKLNHYINSVKSHFSDNLDRDEIISDMENRIAEQFEALNKQDSIIVLAEIEELIKVMGTVDQIDDGEENNHHKKHSETEQGSKKLYRDIDNAIIGGVAAGLGAYFDIDAWIIRLIFIATVFAGGGGVLVYVILWVVIPEARTTSERLEMRGSAINLGSISKNARDARDKVRSAGEKGAVAAGSVLRALAKSLRKLLGLAVTIISGGALAFATFALVAGLVNKNSPYFDFPLAQVTTMPIYALILAIGYVAIFIPWLFILMVGASSLRGKSIFNYKAGFGLLGLWFIVLIAGGAIALRYGPEFSERIQALPEYKVVDKTYDLKNFSKLDIGGNTQLNIIQGKDYSVVVHGVQKDLDNYGLTVDNKGVLRDSFVFTKNHCIFCARFQRMSVDITAPSISDLAIHGASDLVIDKINSNANLIADGASSIEVANLAGDASVHESGASRITITGKGSVLTSDLSGASRLQADNYQIQQATIKASGASRAYVAAQTNLNVDLSGASRVYYSGNPNVISKLSGASKVQPETADPGPDNMDMIYQ